MSFTWQWMREVEADDSMVLEKKDGEVKGWWGVHSQKSRMVIYTPEEGFYIYIVCPFICKLKTKS